MPQEGLGESSGGGNSVRSGLTTQQVRGKEDHECKLQSRVERAESGERRAESGNSASGTGKGVRSKFSACAVIGWETVLAENWTRPRGRIPQSV